MSLESGGQKGNTNAVKAKPWAEAIDRALKQDRAALNRLAAKLIAKAEEGDMAALKEIGDRLDGKPKQQTELTGAGDGPLVIQVVKFADC